MSAPRQIASPATGEGEGMARVWIVGQGCPHPDREMVVPRSLRVGPFLRSGSTLAVQSREDTTFRNHVQFESRVTLEGSGLPYFFDGGRPEFGDSSVQLNDPGSVVFAWAAASLPRCSGGRRAAAPTGSA